MMFGEQAKKWLHQCMLRKRKPVKPGTIRGWESFLDKIRYHQGDSLRVGTVEGVATVL